MVDMRHNQASKFVLLFKKLFYILIGLIVTKTMLLLEVRSRAEWIVENPLYLEF